MIAACTSPASTTQPENDGAPTTAANTSSAAPTTRASTTTSTTTTSTTTSTTTTTTTLPNPPVEACQLPLAAFTNVGLGVPRFDGLAPSVGTVNLAVIFVDFADAPATRTPEQVFSIIDPIVPTYFERTSYGRLTVDFDPHFEWLRLSQPSKFYGESLTGFFTHRAFIDEAARLADDDVDFSGADIILVMANPDAPDVPYGPVFGTTTATEGITLDGTTIVSGITSGFDLNHWGGLWLAHEMGHTMSLPDLYQYGESDIHQHIGTIGMMGNIDAQAGGYFALERWMLGWLDDDQIYCHGAGDIELDITPIAVPDGRKAVMVPINETKVLVVESRRRMGFDSDMVDQGAVVYTADSSIESGFGPVKVLPGVAAGFDKQDAPLGVGESYTFENITVTVVKSDGDGDRVQISVA